ncbi:MAG: N-acetylmuramoyl-L-alanine amidase [Tannerella sp.]|jgi:N-acetylmuramoyl-L-alanine amidase|nr:N-acetylmuramoyl-L-alanine amidase [Tannerella sp.]
MNKRGYIVLCLLTLSFIRATILEAKEKTFTVVIDAGHGGKDPGSVGVRVKEKTVNLAVALKLGALIKNGHEDVRVIYTRETDRFIELSERAHIANRNKADLFISIHANSIPVAKKGRQKVRGVETYTLGLAQSQENQDVAMLENSVILLEDNYQQRYGGFDPHSSESYIIFEFMQNKHMEQSISFASEIQKSFSSIKRIDRGVRQAGFLVLRETNMPGVLVELGFISNPDEENFMRSGDGQKQLAKALYNAFTKYKKEHDQRKGLFTRNVERSDTSPPQQPEYDPEPDPEPERQPTPSSADKPQLAADASNAQTGHIVYKIQILSSDRKLAPNSPLLKGYSVDYYMDGKLYKYTCGESTSQKEILKLLKQISKDFKDAFMIRMKDGKRIK